MTECCEKCKYWAQETKLCRRHPPAMITYGEIRDGKGSIYYDCEQPGTEPNDWCGDFAVRR